jgi:hypothetical protein
MGSCYAASFLQTAYNANFKLMVIWYAKETRKCMDQG